jgi:hypothetical protein
VKLVAKEELQENFHNRVSCKNKTPACDKSSLLIL